MSLQPLRYTLLSDGSSDRALLPVLDWLLSQHCACRRTEPMWADLRRLRRPPRTLPDRILQTLELYPCDVLFVHRDAERAQRIQRQREILQAITVARGRSLGSLHYVCVVPVRMQEAWLLCDEMAIRKASGNPHGHQDLGLPPVPSLESLRNPKEKLHALLRHASELSGRRLKSFDPHRCSLDVAGFICDFSPLRELSAFSALESEIKQLCSTLGPPCPR